MTTPEPSPHNPTVARNQTQSYLYKLFDSLQNLDEGGGLAEAARLGGWKGKKLKKARPSLKAIRDAIDGALGE